MESIRRFIQHTFKDEQTIFGPYIPTENSVPNYSIFNFPFEFAVDVFRGLGKLTKRSKPKPQLTKQVPVMKAVPPEPTLVDYRAKLDQDLADVDLLPITDCEKEEVRAQLKLAFLKKASQTMNCQTLENDAFDKPN